MRDNDFHEEDEPVEDVIAAYEAGEKGRARRPRLDSIHTVRFTPDQVDKIRAHIGDESVSSFLRRVAMAAVCPPQPVRTYRCAHFTMAGSFAEPPTCGQACQMWEQTPTLSGVKTFTLYFAAPWAA